MTPPVLSKCPHCGKCNPEVQALQIGKSEDAIMLGFVPSCCKKLIGCQVVQVAVPQETIQ